MTTSRAVASEVQNVLDYLVDAQIALYANPAVDSGGFVTWRTARASGALFDGRSHPTIQDYRRWAEQGQYSAILLDFSLLQISYAFEKGVGLASHRLQYVPCPYRLDLGDLGLTGDLDVGDLLDLYDNANAEDIVLTTAVRFDFDRLAAKTDHPASHLTINTSSCRIPCAAPIGLGRFLAFVFRHFYPALWRLHPYLGQVPNLKHSGTITEPERHVPHLAWSA
jgi:hypothetical protein